MRRLRLAEVGMTTSRDERSVHYYEHEGAHLYMVIEPARQDGDVSRVVTWPAGAAPLLRRALAAELTGLLDGIVYGVVRGWAEEQERRLLKGTGTTQPRGIFGG